MMESIQWWKSDQIRSQILGLATAFVAVVVAFGALFGITIDPVFQGKLIAAVMAAFAFGCGAFNVWGIIARLNTTTVIQGSAGEKAVIQATGVAPVPRDVKE